MRGAAMLITSLVAAGALHLASGATAFAASTTWSGLVRVDNAVVYDAPGGTPVGTLALGTPVTVIGWVYGPPLTSDNYTWASIDDHRFVHSSMLRHSPLADAPQPPRELLSDGHWADANLTQQTLTLYDGAHPVRTSLMNSGRPGDDTATHEGVWPISSRIANETMKGSDYYVTGVLFTQYFTPDAEALHLSYWLTDDERGIPRSHGCIGLAYDDAAFAWKFLSVGGIVSVHT